MTESTTKKQPSLPEAPSPPLPAPIQQPSQLQKEEFPSIAQVQRITEIVRQTNESEQRRGSTGFGLTKLNK